MFRYVLRDASGADCGNFVSATCVWRAGDELTAGDGRQWRIVGKEPPSSGDLRDAGVLIVEARSPDANAA